MKIVHSFWSHPQNSSRNRDENRIGGGWLSSFAYLASWALSCLQFRKFYDEVELVTDQKGKELLIDLLGLPYTNVVVVLDELNHYNPDLWAIGKLKAYALQKSPFVHVDGDVFLWEALRERSVQSELLVQQFEIGKSYQHWQTIKKELVYIPDCLRDLQFEEEEYMSINAGLMGGNNMDFFQAYVKEAFRFVNENLEVLDRIPIGRFNIMYEQLLFFNLAKEHSIPISAFMDMELQRSSDLIAFHGIPHLSKYQHPFGSLKSDFFINTQLTELLRFYYPDNFYKIKEVLCQMKY